MYLTTKEYMKAKKQKYKFKKLTDLGFKKLPTNDGFVMFELNPATLNKGKN